MQFIGELDTPKGVGKLNGFFKQHSYATGFSPSQDDVTLFAAFTTPPKANMKDLYRWYSHIASFTLAERAKWSGTAAAAAPAKKAAPKKAKKKEMDEDDLFDSDSDDDGEDAMDVMAAAAAKAKKDAADRLAKKEANSRTLVVLEVKPFDSETDLKKLALDIKALSHDGIQNWGQEHKIEPIAFGICKLIISVVIFDSKISMDDLTDLLEDSFGDDIQSIDVATMSKV